MLEILIRGRGGQGAVTAAKLLAIAAFAEGKEVQAFPMFGIERRGAPVSAFVRIDEKPITLRSQIYLPDYAIVLDRSLLPVRAKKAVFVNSKERVNIPRLKTYNFDATTLSLKIFGKPIVNTASVAAFSAYSELVRENSLLKACKELFTGTVLKKNEQAVTKTFKCVKLKG